LRFLGSVFRDEAAAHAQRAPCLYVDGGRYFADGSDGKRIEITGLECNGEPLDGKKFQAKFGATLLVL